MVKLESNVQKLVSSLISGFLFRLTDLARIAIPIQMLMMVLLGVSSLVDFDGISSEEVICMFQNTMRDSFEPMMFWKNGPPPT